MKKITEVIIFMTMILAGIAWILGFDIIYSISAIIMGKLPEFIIGLDI